MAIPDLFVGGILDGHYHLRQRLSETCGWSSILAFDQLTQRLVMLKVFVSVSELTWDEISQLRQETEQQDDNVKFRKDIDSFECEAVNGRGYVIVQSYPGRMPSADCLDVDVVHKKTFQQNIRWGAWIGGTSIGIFPGLIILMYPSIVMIAPYVVLLVMLAGVGNGVLLGSVNGLLLTSSTKWLYSLKIHRRFHQGNAVATSIVVNLMIAVVVLFLLVTIVLEWAVSTDITALVVVYSVIPSLIITALSTGAMSHATIERWYQRP
ncbi:MAG: hypothetical protein ACFB14_24990 [Leptolyngbyaceae cyanobacterium]